MAGVGALAKPVLSHCPRRLVPLAAVRCLLTRFAQAGIGLQRVDHRQEVIGPNDPLKLESGAIFGHPDEVGFDPTDLGQTDNHTFTPVEANIAKDHEALSRDVDNVQMDVATAAVLGNDRIINRMPRGSAEVGYRQLCSNRHGSRSTPLRPLSERFAGK